MKPQAIAQKGSQKNKRKLMRGKRAKIETLFQWLRRDENGKKRLREAYKKATPKEQGISYVEEWEWGGVFSSFGFPFIQIVQNVTL